MMHLFRKAAITALSVIIVAGAGVPAEALPVEAVRAARVETRSDVTPVQYRDYRPGYRGYYGGPGYRDPRPNFRYRSRPMYPPGAFAPPPRYVERPRLYQPAPAPAYRTRDGLNPRHYDWCNARYRSYDPYSNTFQPYRGPRQSCQSPYS